MTDPQMDEPEKLEPHICLAIYGTLAPGQQNHFQVSDLKGQWSKGAVIGTLHEEGWGAAMGCPGMKLDPDGEEIAVDLLCSQELPDHWDRLDTLEGDGYKRVEVDVATPQGTRRACIYVLNT